MISYNEFTDYLLEEKGMSDLEVALAMFCMEEEYGSYLNALEANGYEEADRATYEDAMDETANEFEVRRASYNSFNYPYYECNGNEYLVYDDESEAYSAAVESVTDLIDDTGFTSILGWEDYVEDGWFKEAMMEMEESYAEDIELEGDNTYDNRLVQECYDNGLIDDDDFELDEDGEIDYTQCTVDTYELVDRLANYLYDDNISYYKSAAEWYRSDFGDKDFETVVKEHDLIDRQKISEYVVKEDGIGHILASYDGEDNDYEFDGIKYYIYRTN